jgi:A1 cistron-splicing factor AAR2
MAQSGDDPFASTDSANTNTFFPMESDAAFHATPIVSSSNASKIEDQASSADPTFMQNQISIQRSPSTTKSQGSALTRQLSVKSNGSYDAALGQSSLSNVLSVNVEQSRGRGRGDSNSSIHEAINNCSLTKSLSTSTDRSAKSVHSAKSVRSVHAVGSYPLGSLRVHSPSPTRTPNVEMHACLKSGDVFVVRDMSVGTVFGYDTRAITIKAEDHFEGVRDIPTGAHFIWGGSGASSIRNGFWIMSARRASDELGEVYVKRWDREHEALDEEVSAAEARIQKNSLPEFFDRLQPYTIHNPTTSRTQSNSGNSGTSHLATKDSNMWHHLTSSMKGALLSKITGREWNHWRVSSTDDYKPAVRYSPDPDDPLDYLKDQVLNFVFPKSVRTFSDHSFGRDRTEQALDTSSHIAAIISGNCTYEDFDEIIGEMQFCYATGMILGNFACMEHWAHIVKVVFKAYRLALDLPPFFCKFIKAVHAQFIHDEEGVEGSILDHDPNLSDVSQINFYLE